MTKRKYILISIPLACIFSIILSLILSQPGKDKKDQKEHNTTKDSLSAKKQVQDISNNETLKQTVEGLSVPRYDEKGQETMIIRGESTLLLSNDVYKIIFPEIEVMDSPDTDMKNGTPPVLITSDIAEMNSISNEGYLSENVVIHLDQETRLNTDFLRYLPEKKSIYTDDPVTIHGKGLIIKGQGCEINLVNKVMRIKRDAEMEMDGTTNDLFFLSENSASQTSLEDTISGDGPAEGKTPQEKTFIRSSGKLILTKQADTNVMTFHDNVVVKRGNANIFSDKLVIFLDPETKKTKQAIATGNVLASEGTKIARGDSLSWDVNTQTAVLEDSHKAEFIQEELNIDALKIIFYNATGNIDIPSAGNLKTYTKQRTGKGETPVESDKTDDTITVKWEGKMNFLSEVKEAHFEKDIEVRRKDSILFCNYLTVAFSDQGYNLQSFKATEDIHIIDKKSHLYSEAVGDRVTWNAKNKLTVLRGRPFALLREGNKRQILSPRVLFYGNENNILCTGKGTLYERRDESDTEEDDIKVNWTKQMFYSDAQKKASFYEQAQATRGGHKLDGDQIDAYLDNNKTMHKIIAADNVYFSITGNNNEDMNDTEGLGTLFIWDLIQNVALLTGNPKAELRRENSRTFSEKVYFDMTENRITWEGRPHWQLTTKEIKK
jgi:LPS export ABC transporter protein LptC/lipopolysaccharide transport protein LptA